MAEGGMTIAASAEAKRCGVNMTRAAEARRLCPDITLLQARPARYVKLHEAVKQSIEKHVPITTTYSIDEWAVRLLGPEREPAEAEALARRVKRQIFEDFDGALPCSVGLAPSRLLAKTACELHKPDGLTTLTMDEMPEKLASMKLSDIPGIGEGMDTRLRAADVDTPGKLWEMSRADCRRVWGSVQGEYFWSGFHGVDPVEPATRRRSMGHAHILPPKYRNLDGAYAILTRLLCKAAMRCRRDGYFAHRLRAHVSFESKLSWIDEIELPGVNDTPSVVEHLERLWMRGPGRWAEVAGVNEGFSTPKKVSVDLGGLASSSSTPGNLFPGADRPQRLSAALDAINLKFGPKIGRNAIYPGSMAAVAAYVMDDKIAFGRIPEEGIRM